jgi:hypothetical protein
VSGRARRVRDYVFAIEHGDLRGSATLRFEIRQSARTVASAVEASCVFGYGAIDLAAVAGPGLGVLPRVALFAGATTVGLLQLIFLERRLVRATVTATPQGLYVFNGLRRHFVPWSEVAGFEPSSRAFLFAVKRTNGRPLPMAGLTPGSFGRRGPQLESLERLKEYRSQFSGATR